MRLKEADNSPVEATMRRVDAQAILFDKLINRRRVMELSLEASDAPPKTINVWRNHSIEPILSLAQPYIAYGRWRADFRLSQYDDTLMFSNFEAADVELLWLDSSHYLETTATHEWFSWLTERVAALRNISRVPIIIATWLPDERAAMELTALLNRLPAVYLANLGAHCAEYGVPLIDNRMASMAGTPVGNAAQSQLARKLACHWLPAALFPNIKAVALDLDQTLHVGVLGEDGVDGVLLPNNHFLFQKYIKALQERGIFIGLISRNERSDVEALFAHRQDYALRWSDFSAIEVSWGDKASALVRMAKELRISLDAILFVDDNPGELASVASQLPMVRTVYADPDASLTQRAVHYFPALWRWTSTEDDFKRIVDLKASKERDALLEEIGDPLLYFQTLKISLIFRNDAKEQLGRLADLCTKTNQFNLAMRRFNEAGLAEMMGSSTATVSSIQLTDRLADSGVVAVIAAERRGSRLFVEELCISCRALGRHLEDSLIVEAIRNMPSFVGCDEIVFKVENAPRNQPALEWLHGFLQLTEMPRRGTYAIQAEKFHQFVPAGGISLIKD